MKAISLWQPWASLMAVGAKRNETRSWHTHHRGLLAIHAAKHWDAECAAVLASDVVQSGLRGVLTLRREGAKEDAKERDIIRTELPFGAIVGVVEVVRCFGTEFVAVEGIEDRNVLMLISKEEAAFGNYTRGRFAWLTRNARKLRAPIPYKGSRGFFELDKETTRKVEAQLL